MNVKPGRLVLLGGVELVHDHAGPHDASPERGCVMQLSAWLADEDGTDRPECVDPALAELLRCTSDEMPLSELGAWGRDVAPFAVGVTDAGALLDRLAARRLREAVLPLAPRWPDELRSTTVSAIELVIRAIEHDDGREAAFSAAESAFSMAFSLASSAADSTAYSAARSASSAARSAARSTAASAASASFSAGYSAAYSAGHATSFSAADSASFSTASSAAFSAEGHRILEELRALRSTPNPRGGAQ